MLSLWWVFLLLGVLLLIIGIIRQVRKMQNFFNDALTDSAFNGMAATAICFLLGIVLTLMGVATGIISALQ